MPQYRLIAIDLDGTLLSPTGQVTPRVRAAVHNALSAGLLVCFATGRNWTESRTILEAVGHYPTAVFVGGAVVIDTHQRVTLHRTMMEPTLAAQVCGFLESFGHAVLALQETESAGVDYLISGEVELNAPTRQWMQATSATVHRVPLLGSYPHPHTIRVGIVSDLKEISRIRAETDKKFGERVLCHNLTVPSQGLEIMEVFDPAVNKWEGILHVARQHGVEPHEIIAIGDDMNDIAMISRAGLGVAMGNARPEVIAVAKRVIGTNKEEGLAAFLDELVASHMVEPAE